jgi:L-amino acid N-acyltransferase YncA
MMGYVALMRPTGTFAVRSACVGDEAAIARIYNAGIDSREATFETAHRTPADIAAWFTKRYPIAVVTRDGGVVAFASTSEYRGRACYAGIAEFSVYVDPAHQRQGAGFLALDHLISLSAERGFWKLVSRVFVENDASRRLLRRCGFREVGVYRRHGCLAGRWRDVVIVERLLEESLPPDR